ncbi:MAG: ABC transporter ATP-binding protein [Christensenellales bacterium]|jgi:ATP-binding cassette subfamily B multidrug efflux pump
MTRKFKLLLFTGLAATAFLLTARMVTPMISARMVDEVIMKLDLTMMPKLLITLLGLSVLSSSMVYFRGVLFELMSQKIIFSIRTEMFEHLHTLPFAFYDKHRIGEIMSRMTQDVEAIRHLIAGGLVTILEQTFYYVGAMIMISTISPLLALTLLCLTPLLGWVCFRLNRAVRPRFDAMRDQSAVLNTHTQENISGIRVVKAYAMEAHEKERFREENEKHRDSGIAITRTFAKYHPIINFISSIIPALMLLIGGYFAVKGVITAGQVVAVFGYIWMVTDPMHMLPHILNMLVQATSAGERIFYYMDFGSELKAPKRPKRPAEYKGEVTFENVSFSYGDELVLKDIDLKAAPGSTIAIMGATGSGKSSLVNLISRFYDVRSGRVLVDGIDVRDYDSRELRRHIGIVQQETFLFSDTLRDNIAFGRPDAPMETVRTAARIAQAEEYIDALPEGYNTVVGERGLGLSGGQKQRASIARAILPDPEILVMDDATSAVDLETESAIQTGLKEVLGKRTTFIISHRISAVKDADEILVLEHGRVAERGKHADLMEKKGLYYGIFMDQYRDFQAVMGKEAEA